MSEVTQVIEFDKMVAQLAKPGQKILETLTPEKCHQWHMGTGIVTEAGELMDAIKKVVAYNKEPDLENIKEEMGDIEFYLEGLRQSFGITRQETIDLNIQKLGVRYRNHSYSDTQASERADKQEEERVIPTAWFGSHQIDDEE